MANQGFHETASTTAETKSFTATTKQVSLTNRDATDTLYATIAAGNTSAASVSALTVAVAAAAGTICVPPGQRRVLAKSTRDEWVSVSVIATANTPAYSLEGTDFRD